VHVSSFYIANSSPENTIFTARHGHPSHEAQCIAPSSDIQRMAFLGFSVTSTAPAADKQRNSRRCIKNVSFSINQYVTSLNVKAFSFLRFLYQMCMNYKRDQRDQKTPAATKHKRVLFLAAVFYHGCKQQLHYGAEEAKDPDSAERAAK
jgi:hypothetical protein